MCNADDRFGIDEYDAVPIHAYINTHSLLHSNKTRHPPSLAMTEREAGWKPTIPATLSLASITMTTVSELGRIRLPPVAFTSPMWRLSLSSGSLSSLITISMVFFISPVHREDKVHAKLGESN